MGKNGDSKLKGFYVACSEDAHDALVLFGRPLEDVPRLVRGEKGRRAKPVLPGVNIEKVGRKVSGVRLYKRSSKRGASEYPRVGSSDLKQLRALIDYLAPTVAELKRMYARLSKNAKTTPRTR